MSDHNADSNMEIDSSRLAFEELVQERDVALYALNELSHRIVAAYPVPLLNVLRQVIQICNEPEVKAATWFKIAQCVPLVDLEDQNFELAHLADMIDLRNVQSRDLWNAQLRASGSFVGSRLRRALHLDLVFLDDLVTALRVSQQDEVEMPTRLNAADATSDVLDVVFCEDAKDIALLRSCQMRLLFLLYDFLNDDDEDVRGIATTAVYNLLKHKYGSEQIITQCAAAARNIVVDFLSTMFHSHSGLILNASLRIVGGLLSAGIGELDCTVALACVDSVSKTFGEIVQSTNDLFAEERQNLYVDDVAEIEIWEAVVKTDNLAPLPQAALSTLASWTTDGLDSILALLKSEVDLSNSNASMRESDSYSILHPVGWTYNAEVMILFKRVITMARLLCSTIMRSKPDKARIVTIEDRLGKQLRDIKAFCDPLRVHRSVLVLLDSTLSD